MRNQRGVAMMMALITMFLLAIIAGEIVYQAGVYSSVVFRQRDLFRAQLLARSGLRLALLQLRAAKKAKAKAKAMGLGDNTSVVDQIWKTPLMLPPPENLPGLAPSDAAALAEFRKSLGLDGTVSVNIQGENGRMGINQLVWPSFGSGSSDIKGVSQGGDQVDPNAPWKTVQPGTQPQVGTGQNAEEQRKEAQKKVRDSFVQLFQNMLDKKRQDDDAFRDKYPSLTGEQVVGNILAWMDPFTTNDGDQRDKNDYYGRAEPSPYAPKNAPIASDSEYHMIKALTDDTIAKIVSDNFTTQSTSSLDVNKASLLLIQSLIPDLKADVIEAIGKRRTDDSLGGPFKDANDFWTFVARYGNYDDAKKDVEKRGIKILEADTTFHVVISAESGLSHRTWLADIGPLPPKIDPEQPKTNQPQAQPTVVTPGSATGSTSTSTNTSTADSGDFDSLSVVYLKAD